MFMAACRQKVKPKAVVRRGAGEARVESAAGA